MLLLTKRYFDESNIVDRHLIQKMKYFFISALSLVDSNLLPYKVRYSLAILSW